MRESKALRGVHPQGELERRGESEPVATVETFAGKVGLRWDEEAGVTAFGQLPYFVEFLKTSGLFEAWVQDCPLSYSSPNAPSKREVLATLLLSVLAGQRRYAHIDALRADTLAPALLGVNKLVSEDSARRAFQSVDEDACQQWLDGHLKRSYEELLEEDWILDVDATVKPLYGSQQGALLGYNPAKPGRPSHVYHSYMAANIRLLLGVEVQQGNQTAPSYAQPRLWRFLDELEPERRPKLLRGDAHWGSEHAMLGAEQRGVDYLFRLRQTVGVKRLITRLFASDDWAAAGQGWQGVRSRLRLQGWSRSREVIVLRRQLRDSLALDQSVGSQPRQLSLGLAEVVQDGVLYEYVVLATSLDEELEATAQLYRDRGDAENNFDELKNQWGWTGYTTRDLKRSRVMAGVIALVYNWWGLFTRLAAGAKGEAITTRPLLLHGIARRTRHSRQTTLTITSSHAKAKQVRRALEAASGFLKRVAATAEQLGSISRWRLILSWIFRDFLDGRVAGTQLRLVDCLA
jgi:hypothetical protein